MLKYFNGTTTFTFNVATLLLTAELPNKLSLYLNELELLTVKLLLISSKFSAVSTCSSLISKLHFYYLYITLAKFCENSSIVLSFFPIIMKILVGASSFSNLPIKLIC